MTTLNEIAQKPRGERLEELLERADLNQRQAARLTGLHFNTLNGWINREVVPTTASLYRLYRVLEERIDGLQFEHLIGEGEQ